MRKKTYFQAFVERMPDLAEIDGDELHLSKVFATYEASYREGVCVFLCV